MPRFLLAGLLILSVFGTGCVDAPSTRSSADVVSDSTLTRIAFGSCNRQSAAQPLWTPIQAANPDLWVWLGDNIYADTDDMAAMDSMYAVQKEKPGYRALQQQTPVIGTWDDHDYGANDAGRTYPKRDSSQQLLLDFLDIPEDSPRRAREGAYSSYVYGPPGQRVKVILLDTRYHRDPLTSNPLSEQRYFPNRTGDILGEEQWAWLERELTNSDAQIHLIGTSIQAVAEQHPWEKWANFPAAHQRLYDVIDQSDASGVLLLSGDRHIAELSRHDDAIDYPLYDLTSSGLTHHAPPHEEANRHRVDSMITDLHYGLLTIDWEAEPTTIRMEIRGEENERLLDHTVSLGDLQPAG